MDPSDDLGVDIATVERFAAATRDDPGAPAVEDTAGVVARADLLDAARSLSAPLLEAVGVGGLVAVLVGRDRRLPAALLGVHAAACAYIALDPGPSDRRVRRVLDAIPVDAVLAAPELQARVPAHLPLLLTDGTWIRRPDRRSSGRFAGVAYLVDAGRGTDAPRCVQVGHETLDVHIAGTESLLGPGDGQVWQAVSPLDSDSHVTEFLVAMTGRAVVCVQPGDPQSVMTGPLLVGTRSSGPVTHMQCTVEQLETFASRPEVLERLRSMQAILVGGGPVPGALVPRLAGGRVRLFTVYGKPEATVWVAGQEIGPHEVGELPVGAAIERSALRVLGDDGHEVAAGTVGRLFIGGDSLAHGYVGNPALTAELFTPDPWSPDGGRLHDTGDLAVRDRVGDVTVLSGAPDRAEARDAAARPGAADTLRKRTGDRLPPHQAPGRCGATSSEPRTTAAEGRRPVDARPGSQRHPRSC